MSRDLPYSIGIDILGGDAPPELLIEAIFATSTLWKAKARLVLFATPSLIEKFPSPPANVVFFPVQEVITMQDPPLVAVRHKKNSSLCKALQQLKDGTLHACISSGNTGAVVAASQITLGSLFPVSRPALLTLLPLKNDKKMALLDVGASFGGHENYFLELAFLGIAYQKARGIAHPTVALLNVGAETHKGTKPLQEAYSKLLALSHKFPSLFSFMGNQEGRNLFSGDLDVLLTDGFTGNIFLKTAEGVAGALLDELETLLPKSPALATLSSQLRYKEHPGSLLCGVQGLVMKCHGDAGPKHIQTSIDTIVHLLEDRFFERFCHFLKEMSPMNL